MSETDDSRSRTPVMKDAARLAGVSPQTVSRVLNAHPNVSAATRERVQNAVRQLGYRPNAAARSLVTRRSMTVGVVSVDTAHYGPACTLFAITEAARQSGYAVNLVTLMRIDHSGMQAALDRLVTTSVDGIIVIVPVAAAAAAIEGLAVDRPVIVVEAGAPDGMTSVTIDQVLGARRATRHLLDLGHKTVWHLRGPAGWFEADARALGWRNELVRSNRRVPTPFVGDWSPDSGYVVGQQIAHRGEISGIFVANDQMALGVLRALHDEGVTVPDDVSVVGFDDVPESGYYRPPLTTVRQDFVEVGRRCVDQLLRLLRGEDSEAIAPVQPALIVRASSSAPRKATRATPR